jgi:hypothetical protein
VGHQLDGPGGDGVARWATDEHVARDGGWAAPGFG